MSAPSGSSRRILIVGVNWLGDLMFMTPAIRAIRRAYPEGYLVCLIPPRGMDLVRGNPHVNKVIPVEEARGVRGLLQFFPLVRRLRAEKFDTVFFFHRSLSRVLAAWWAGIPSRIGYRTWKQGGLLTHAVESPPRDSLHKVKGFLNLVGAVGIPPDGMHYDSGLLPKDDDVAQRLLQEWGVTSRDRLVALHPGANWRLKRWPARNFAQLADGLSQQHHTKVLFIGGSGDLPLVEKITRSMQTRPLVATGRTTFRELGALLKQVSLFISNDSGPLHLGIAVGAPIIALFGPTDPKLTGPMNGGKSVTLVGSIGCPVPCYQLQCPVNLCMHQITVQQVLDAARPFLT